MKRLAKRLLILVFAMLAVTVPFMLCDKVFGYMDYLFPLLYALGYVVLFSVVFLVICFFQKLKAGTDKGK